LLLIPVFLHIGCQNSNATSQTDSAAQTTATATPNSVALKTPANETADHRPLIVALGDSLTAGYGLDAMKAWPALLQQRLDQKGLKYRVVNKGISGDTSAGGVRRIEDALQGEVKILVLELGGNDLLRGLSVADLKKNLGQMIEIAQRRKITVIIAGMEAPPNYGSDFTRDFRNVFRDLAKQYKATLIPFFLADVGGIVELNHPDGIHPNEKGAVIVMENVWRVLEPVLKKEKSEGR
jgi:acyl-CoA thioesterase I